MGQVSEAWIRIWDEKDKEKKIAMKAYLRVHSVLPQDIPEEWFVKVKNDEMLIELGKI